MKYATEPDMLLFWWISANGRTGSCQNDNFWFAHEKISNLLCTNQLMLYIVLGFLT